ncbi:MAG TPA: hypothetical protein VFV10_15860 [Gammaproteobacteria bacterium]|nr:hypothetical protein [Gammaproteobacteria bacterium]
MSLHEKLTALADCELAAWMRVGDAVVESDGECQVRIARWPGDERAPSEWMTVSAAARLLRSVQ